MSRRFGLIVICNDSGNITQFATIYAEYHDDSCGRILKEQYTVNNVTLIQGTIGRDDGITYYW